MKQQHKPQHYVPPEGTYCHHLIAETAKALATRLYQHSVLRNNEFFAQNRSEKDFVAACWPSLIEEARSTLVDMLRGPYPEELKTQIHEAMVLDNTLTRGRPERVASRSRTGMSPAVRRMQ